MNHLLLILKREYLTKIRNKSFIIMTILSPVILVVLFAVIYYLSMLNNDKVNIYVLDESNLMEEVLKNSNAIEYTFLEKQNLQKAKKNTEQTDAYGLLYIPENKNLKQLAKSISFYAEDTPSMSVLMNLENLLSKKLTNLSFKEEGIDIKKIETFKIEVSIQQESYVGEKTSKMDNFLKIVFGLTLGYLLFMFIIIYGNMIMRSVIEEKTSRIIEIIISSVKPIQLMFGKIIGTSLVGITQFVIWVFIVGILMLIVSNLLGIESLESDTLELTAQGAELQENIANIWWSIERLPILNLILAFITFFTFGYLLYGSIYAAIGAAVDNETDTQQFLTPILMPLILAVYVGIFTVIENPNGTVSMIFSFIPLTSPVVMLMRIPFGVPIWEQITSLLILIVAFLLVVWLGAKIYRVGILMYGKKPKYKELFKWLKY